MSTIFEIKQKLISQADRIAEMLLPQGHKRGNNWIVGNTRGEAGQSLSICLSGSKAGLWYDFAEGIGGDLLDLWCEVKGISLSQALEEARAALNLTRPKPFMAPHRSYRRPPVPTGRPPQNLVKTYLHKERHIPLEIIKRYRIGEDGEKIIFPFYKPDGTLALVKERLAQAGAKTKPTAAHCEPILFGWQALCPSNPTAPQAPQHALSTNPAATQAPQQAFSTTPAATQAPQHAPSSTPTTTNASQHAPSSTPAAPHAPQHAPSSTPAATQAPQQTPSSTPAAPHAPQHAPSSTPTTTNASQHAPSSTPTTTNASQHAPSSTPTTTNASQHAPSSTPTATQAPQHAPSTNPTAPHASQHAPSSNPAATQAPQHAPSTNPTATQAPQHAPSSTPAATQAPQHAPSSNPAATQAPQHAPSTNPTATQAPQHAPSSTPAATQAPQHAPSTNPAATQAPQHAPSSTPAAPHAPQQTPSSTPAAPHAPQHAPSSTPTAPQAPQHAPSSPPAATQAPQQAPLMERAPFPLLSSTNRTIVITEGEIDALSLAAYGYPAVSVPFGGGSGGKHNWIENEFDHLEAFETIFLATDMDKPGEEAAREIASRLGRHRCYRVRLPLKDANDCLTAGIDRATIKAAFSSAKSFAPEGLRRASDYKDKVIGLFWPEPEKHLGYTVPYPKLKDKVHFRPAELTLWSGASGAGKSQLLSDCIPHWIAQNSRLCLASLEMKGEQSLRRLTKQTGGLEQPTKETIERILHFLDEGLILYEHVGKSSVDTLLDVFDYCRARYGCDQFIIDSLMRLGIASDDYARQEQAVYKMVDWAVLNSVHIHLVAHARKSGLDKDIPSTEDIKGASEIGANAFNIITIWRNRPLEDKIFAASLAQEKADLAKRPGVIMNIAKQRSGDFEGKIGLWFDPQTYRYRCSFEQSFPRRYL
ncbi:toprim domain-containing protein [Bartonella sp. AC10YNML]|uniref:bifunctional DNA primase/helicase n=1 Tax=Bartonella sp. AC10YNML TaxID=3243444 RepID=UPI0035CEE360